AAKTRPPARRAAGGWPEHSHAGGREQRKAQFCRQDIEAAAHGGEPDRRAYLPSCRAADQRNEIAASQFMEMHSIPLSQDRVAGYRMGRDQSAGIAAPAKPVPAALGHRSRKCNRSTPGLIAVVAG